MEYVCHIDTLFCMIFQADWPAPMPAIGRIANFSSLRKHNPKEYSIYDAYFGKCVSCILVINLTKTNRLKNDWKIDL